MIIILILISIFVYQFHWFLPVKYPDESIMYFLVNTVGKHFYEHC